MNHKLAGTIATLMALFFLYATARFAEMPKAGSMAIASLFIFMVMVSLAGLAFGQTKRVI